MNLPMCCSARPVKPGETGKCMAVGLFCVAGLFGVSYGLPHIASLGFNRDLAAGASLSAVFLALSVGVSRRYKRDLGAKCLVGAEGNS